MSETQKTVLIINDDADMAAMARLRLEFAGYRVLTCRDRQTGFKFAVERCSDVILLDLQMPNTDGFATLAGLHRCQETRSIPVVAFSVDRGTPRQVLAMGVRHYVDKPYNSPALTETIGRAIEDSVATPIRQHANQETTQRRRNDHRKTGRTPGPFMATDQHHLTRP